MMLQGPNSSWLDIKPTTQILFDDLTVDDLTVDVSW